MTCDIGISYLRAQRTTSRSCGTQVRTAAFESVPTGLTAYRGPEEARCHTYYMLHFTLCTPYLTPIVY
jgi:hypothetical protein